MPRHKRKTSSSIPRPRRSRRVASEAASEEHYNHEDSSSGGEDNKGEAYDTDDYRPEEEEDEESEHEEGDTAESEKGENDENRDFDDAEDETERLVTVIPYETLRPLDGVEYAPSRVHKNTLLYLKDLRANNKRSWFKSHEKEFRRASKDWESYVEALMPKIIAFDPTIPELPPKDVIFRIYRDVRFSKDQRPYKSHFSAAYSRTGRRRPYACYYIHLDPGSSYVGGGLWAPEPPTIQLIRESIDERPGAWRQLLNSTTFRATFLPKAKGGVDGALTAFANINKEGALKTRPKGFRQDHLDIELLKLRHYHVVKPIEDNIFTTEGGQERILDMISILQPFVLFLNSIIMPDPDEP